MQKRIVITGIGVISPVGTGKKKFWDSLVNGISGVRELTSPDFIHFRAKIGGEVPDFVPQDYMGEEEIDKYGKAAQYTYAAAKMALEDAEIEIKSLMNITTAVCMGTTMGEVLVIEKIDKRVFENRCSELDAVVFRQCVASNITSVLMNELKLQGPEYLFFNACASGNYAIGYAYDLLLRGKSDIAIAGGIDLFSKILLTGFNRLFSLTPDVCRPFDKNRKGLVVSEGAGVLIMEDMESAKKRGANIYAEVKGYGLGMDAYHITSPHPEAEGAIASMQMALKNSGLMIDDIDYISAHGTGTSANDKVESYAIRKVFSTARRIPPVSSIKSMMGHAMGAASALEAIACCLMIQNRTILPTINFTTPDPGCIEDCVPNQPRSQELKHVMSNAFAFGGNTSCLILSKC